MSRSRKARPRRSSATSSRAALQTLDENVTLLDDDERLHALLHGVTSAFIKETDATAGPRNVARITYISSMPVRGQPDYRCCVGFGRSMAGGSARRTLRGLATRSP